MSRDPARHAPTCMVCGLPNPLCCDLADDPPRQWYCKTCCPNQLEHRQWQGEQTLILMVGLPRSGKSTYCRRWTWPRVCPDAIRLALYGERWRKEGERMVWTQAHYMVRALFGAGHHTVVLDATNLTARNRADWRNTDWQTTCCYVPTPADICKERALKLNMPDLVPVIDNMAAIFEPPHKGEFTFQIPYEPSPS